MEPPQIFFLFFGAANAPAARWSTWIDWLSGSAATNMPLLRSSTVAVGPPGKKAVETGKGASLLLCLFVCLCLELPDVEEEEEAEAEEERQMPDVQ